MIESIIFDWDDVFTQGSTEGYFRCYHQALERVGVNMSPDEEKQRILQNWGASVEVELGGLLAEQPKLLNDAVKEYESILFGNTFVDCLTLVEGSSSLVDRLKGQYKLSIATGVNPKLLKEVIMPRFGFTPNAFSPIVSVYDVDDPNKGKPHPYMIKRILKEQQVSPHQAVMVSDAKGDVAMAKAAGVIPIIVLTGHLTREQAQGLGVEYIIPDVTHLEEILVMLQ